MTPAPQSAAAVAEDMSSQKVMDLMDNTLWNRQMKDVTLDVVDLLVRQIYAGIRAYMAGAYTRPHLGST